MQGDPVRPIQKRTFSVSLLDVGADWIRRRRTDGGMIKDWNLWQVRYAFEKMRLKRFLNEALELGERGKGRGRRGQALGGRGQAGAEYMVMSLEAEDGPAVQEGVLDLVAHDGTLPPRDRDHKAGGGGAGRGGGGRLLRDEKSLH